MSYTIFNSNELYPSEATQDIIWSTLLIGDKITFASPFALFVSMKNDYKMLPEDTKRFVHILLNKLTQGQFAIEPYEKAISMKTNLQNKSQKTQLEMTKMNDINVAIKKIESDNQKKLDDLIAIHNFSAIAPLTQLFDDRPEPEVRAILPVVGMEYTFEPGFELNIIELITDVLKQADNMLVLDERIFSIAIDLSLEQYDENNFQQEEKPVIYSKKLLKIPLFKGLSANEIRIIRKELSGPFRSFHSWIHKIADRQCRVQEGIEQISLLLPDLQAAIDSNSYIKAVSGQPGNSNVDLNIGFTSIRGLLTIMKQLDLLKEEQVLQATDQMLGKVHLDSRHPFIFITH